jgi:predicted MFS family arabinose efflux permease
MTFIPLTGNKNIDNIVPMFKNSRFSKISHDLTLFAFASVFMGIAYSMYDSIFNNYINSKFDLSGFQRSFLELPRELPGFLVVFVSAGLWFLCSRRLGAFALGLGVIGAILVGFGSKNFWWMAVWLFVYSMGQHLFMPLSASIGMDLAHSGRTGKRLGQLNAIRNFAAILGSFTVLIGFRYLNFSFNIIFILSALGLAIAAFLLFRMKPDKAKPSALFLKLHRPYRLYYLLAILFGMRKQLFITFAPWVLVKVFNQPTQIMATLFMVGGIIGILFQPFLGWVIDRYGERLVLVCEAIILVFVCFGYGFSQTFFTEEIAFAIVIACFLTDQMLMSVGMARSTYMKKIALDPDHVQPALTASITIDHIFSITGAIIGGIIWSRFGYQYVFLMGMGIALVNVFIAWQVKIPSPSEMGNAVVNPDIN